MVVKRWEDYNFFKKYFEINWAHLEGCYDLDANNRQLDVETPNENVLQGMFHPFLYGSLSVLALIGVFGLMYEIMRRKLCTFHSELPTVIV